MIDVHAVSGGMMNPRNRLLLLASLVLACGDTGDSDTSFGVQTEGAGSSSPGDATAAVDASTGGAAMTSAGSDPSTSAGSTGPIPDPPKLDVGAPDTTGGEMTGPMGCFPSDGCRCPFDAHQPCDAGTNDPFEAMGIGCPGEPMVMTSIDAAPVAWEIRGSFGATNVFDAREGDVYAVLSTGDVSELDNETPAPPEFNQNPTYCNNDVGAMYDLGGTLPAPLDPTDVGAVDCVMDPSLVGTGDCSNSIEGQFSQGMSAEDYAEFRFQATVPADVEAFRFDFAFFSVEWPFYDGSEYNDLFVGWLESEAWTGNISFDGMGNPISLNAAFFQLTDNGGNLAEFDGTCMRKHGGSGWLSTTTGVTPGEDITLVFAIFDMSDSILDSFVFLDNFEWGCQIDDPGPPVTEPAG
jgi:hypothetical protein